MFQLKIEAQFYLSYTDFSMFFLFRPNKHIFENDYFCLLADVWCKNCKACFREELHV